MDCNIEPSKMTGSSNVVDDKELLSHDEVLKDELVKMISEKSGEKVDGIKDVIFDPINMKI
mgnify:CR=1 FL=1